MTTQLSIAILLAALLSACAAPQPKTISGTGPTHKVTEHSATGTISKQSLEQTRLEQVLDGLSKTNSTASATNPAPELATRVSKPFPEDLWHTLGRDQTFASQLSHPRVKPFLTRYNNKQAYFHRLTMRGSRYLPYIAAQLKQENMAAELALLPFIESGYNPFAYSHSGAAGLWQFIPPTARHLGLKSNWWYDGRRDLVASTEAALRYLRYLHQRFNGDWLLALAAYNGGEGTISRAVRRNRSKGLSVDYWALDLPPETAAYVPHFLAFIQVVADPAKYGLTLPKLSTEINFNVVVLDQQIDLQQAARFANIEVESLYQLNSGFLRWATPPSGPFSLLLPSTSMATFNRQIALIPKSDRLASQHHIVQRGDTLGEIAQHYHVSLDSVVSANALKSLTIIDGQLLKIPAGVRQFSSMGKAKLPTSPAGKLSYQVRKGDTLSGIARKYQVSLKDLLSWNQWPATKPLHPSQTLIVAAAGQQQKSNQKSIKYRVKKGDSLSRIAQQFDVAINDIVLWNSINKKALLRPGQNLVLYPRS